MHGSYWSMATSMKTPHSVATQPGCGPDHSFTIRHCSKCAWHFINSHFVLLVFQPWFYPPWAGLLVGGPLAAKRTIHGSHTWSGETIYGNIICHRWSGDQLWRGINCSVTDWYSLRLKMTGPLRIINSPVSYFSLLLNHIPLWKVLTSHVLQYFIIL